MKITNHKSNLIRLSGLILILMLNACASKYAFETSQTVPAARGTVKVKKDGNNNYLIKVFVSNLAEVTRLQPPKQSYVIWMVGDENITKNIGKITSSSNMLSSKLQASFQTVSASKPHRIFTAEDNTDITVPGSMIILSTAQF